MTAATSEVPPDATYARAPTAASIITLVEAIEAHPAGAPAAVAFRHALARKGREADAAGGVQVLDDLLREVALSDSAKARPPDRDRSRSVGRPAIGTRRAVAGMTPDPRALDKCATAN